MNTSRIQIKPFLIATILTLTIMISIVIGLLKVIGKDTDKIDKINNFNKELLKEKKNTINKKDKKHYIGYYLFEVEVLPLNSKIRILNIKPKYKKGIKLRRGKYHIEISKKGYKTIHKWIEIKNKNLRLKVKLNKFHKKSTKKKQINVNSLFDKV